jgi:hypothetical protein
MYIYAYFFEGTVRKNEMGGRFVDGCKGLGIVAPSSRHRSFADSQK